MDGQFGKWLGRTGTFVHDSPATLAELPSAGPRVRPYRPGFRVPHAGLCKRADGAGRWFHAAAWKGDVRYFLFRRISKRPVQDRIHSHSRLRAVESADG